MKGKGHRKIGRIGVSDCLLKKTSDFDSHPWMKVPYGSQEVLHTTGEEESQTGHVEEGKRHSFPLPM